VAPSRCSGAAGVAASPGPGRRRKGVPQLTPRRSASPRISPQLVRKRSNSTVAYQRLVSTIPGLFVLSAS
jgi:hypothetical protein